MDASKDYRTFTWYEAKEEDSIFLNTKNGKLYFASKGVLRDYYQVFFKCGNSMSQLYTDNNMVRVARKFRPEKHVRFVPNIAEES